MPHLQNEKKYFLNKRPLLLERKCPFCSSKDSIKAISDVIRDYFRSARDDIKSFDFDHIQKCPFWPMPLHFRNAYSASGFHINRGKLPPYKQALRRISSPRTKLLAARCECLHLIKIDCLALRLDESAHACTRSELRGASCEDWKSAFRQLNFISKKCISYHILTIGTPMLPYRTGLALTRGGGGGVEHLFPPPGHQVVHLPTPPRQNFREEKLSDSKGGGGGTPLPTPRSSGSPLANSPSPKL